MSHVKHTISGLPANGLVYSVRGLRLRVNWVLLQLVIHCPFVWEKEVYFFNSLTCFLSAALHNSGSRTIGRSVAGFPLNRLRFWKAVYVLI